MKNTAASVRQRLTTLARKRGVAFNRVLVQYGIERLLYRLSESPYSEKFILKGAMLFVVWQGAQHRETRDVDLLGFGDNAVEEVTRLFHSICATSVMDDGLVFEEVTAAPITALQEYGGVTVKINARLEKARIVVNVDIGFGDKVTPKPELVEFPALLEYPPPRVRAYPPETVIAEKLHAMVLLGERNSRMKDFFDVLYLSAKFEFQGDVLLEAIRGTFERRNTLLPSSFPVALSDEFAAVNETMWRAFLKRSGQTQATTFTNTVQKLRAFLEPVFNSPDKLTTLDWPKGGTWAERRD